MPGQQLVLMVPTYKDWKRHLQFPIAVMMTTAEPFEGKPLCFSTTPRPCLETAAEASLEVFCSCWLLPGEGGILKKPETDQLTPWLQHGRGQSIAGKGIRKGWKQNLHPTQTWRNLLHWYNQSFLLIYPANVAVLVDFRKERGIGRFFNALMYHIPGIVLVVGNGTFKKLILKHFALSLEWSLIYYKLPL